MGLFHSPSPVMAEGKTHLSLVVCGHVDAGKSTTTGHLLFELGGISEREMEKLKEKAAQLGKSSFSFAFYLDTQKDERERGVTISCTTKEFFTDKYHYTIIDAPGHRDFVNNMDNPSPTPYLQSRFEEIAGEVVVMLKTAGYKEDKIKKEFPFIPISGWEGDNLVKKTEKMAWYKGVDLEIDGNKIHVDTLKDAFNDACFPPKRTDDAAMRTCVSGVYKIKGVGDVITGRVEQGAIIKESKVKFPPSDGKMPCRGKVFSIEMHHKQVERAMAGDNVGLNIKGLSKENMPRVGDIICDEKDGLTETAEFTMQVAVQDHPGQLKAATYDEKSKEYRGGFCPIAFARTARAPVQLKQIDWKMGKKSTGGAKVEGAEFIEKNDMAQVVFAPKGPIVVTSFKECAGLGRVAIMDSNALVMLGKVVKCSYKS